MLQLYWGLWSYLPVYLGSFIGVQVYNGHG